MVKGTIDKEIIDSVKKYRDVVKTSGVSVDKIIIFGSQAKGTANKNSDIDVAVVSKDFGIDDIEEMQKLWKKTRFADTRIEPYPLSIDEFENGFSPIISEIRKYGIVVA